MTGIFGFVFTFCCSRLGSRRIVWPTDGHTANFPDATNINATNINKRLSRRNIYFVMAGLSGPPVAAGTRIGGPDKLAMTMWTRPVKLMR